MSSAEAGANKFSFYSSVEELINSSDPSIGEIEDTIRMLNTRRNLKGRDKIQEMSDHRKSGITILEKTKNDVSYNVYGDGVIMKKPSGKTFVRLYWDSSPRKVLLIKKPGVELITNTAVQCIRHLGERYGVITVVEPAVYDELHGDNLNICSWSSDEEYQVLADQIDFVVCLGGDGTLLWANTLFKRHLPPVLSFSLGTLGFLTALLTDNYEEAFASVMNGGCELTLRSRLVCKVFRVTNPDNLTCSNEITHEFEHNGELEVTFSALNEVSIDRGNCPYLSEIDCYHNDRFLTPSRADGVLISTPTGSTAYSLSAGGSILHPQVNAMMLTPVCPHSLSFRPIIFPDSSKLTFRVNKEARATAWVSGDGKHRLELRHGDYVEITTSIFPFPSICNKGESLDWVKAVTNGLKWNSR